MKKGLITIATGNIHYYRLAANLLKSYRLFAETPLPFAIIAEEENEYTALFDDVIITAEANRSFLDKFLLLKLCPYDEALFFDADTLAFGDLNRYWDSFKNATDFSSLGENFPLEKAGGAWYDVDGIGDYAKRIKYKTRVHMGVCFIRNSEKTLKLYQDCIEIYNNLDQLHFHPAIAPVDECVLGLAMPLNDMLAIPEDADMMGCYPCLTKIKANILKKKLEYMTKWGTASSQGILVHWGTAQTHDPLYRFNVGCLNCMVNHKESSFLNQLLYKYEVKLFILNALATPKRAAQWLLRAAYYIKQSFKK